MLYVPYQFPTIKKDNQILFVAQQEHHILLQRRKEFNLTQQQVADRAGIQLRQYQRLEKGERNISSSSGRIMLSICEVLKLDPYLFFGKENKPEKKYVVLPPLEKDGLIYAIPELAYFILVSAIPQGMVCVDDEIIACLRKAYGNDTLEIKTSIANSVNIYSNTKFPFWRVVANNGQLVNTIYCSKQKQKELLFEDGVSTICYREEGSYIVDDKYRFFNTNNFELTVMKTLQEFENEIKTLKDNI